MTAFVYLFNQRNVYLLSLRVLLYYRQSLHIADFPLNFWSYLFSFSQRNQTKQKKANKYNQYIWPVNLAFVYRLTESRKTKLKVGLCLSAYFVFFHSVYRIDAINVLVTVVYISVSSLLYSVCPFSTENLYTTQYTPLCTNIFSTFLKWYATFQATNIQDSNFILVWVNSTISTKEIYIYLSI